MKTNDRPVVAILVPLASREAKSKWDMACIHLRQTLNSIQNSSDGNYLVVVAGREAPDFNIRFDSRFHFLEVNHPIPSRENYRTFHRLDKLAKIEAAWDYAKSTSNPNYLMKLDADDFISSRLVGWLQSAGGEAGYLIKHGWVWRSGSRYLIQRTEYLDRICGSCLIIRSDLADRRGPFLTEAEGVCLDEASSRFAVNDQYSLVPGSETTTLLLNDSHQRYAAQFAYLGHKVCTVPFHAVVYRTSNPDSSSRLAGVPRPRCTSRMLIGRIRRTRFITKRLKKEFMLA
jgi:exopolysaccharide biosynthesis galactosyltransferase PssJ